MARNQGVAKLEHTRESISKAEKPSLQRITQPQNARPRFPHLCYVCYALTSRISEIRPTIPQAYKHGLRFRRTFIHPRTKQCSFCALLFQSLSAHKVKIELKKPVRFILVAPGPEEDTQVELYDLNSLDIYWEGLIKSGHRFSETRYLGRFMVSAVLGSPAAQFISNRPPTLDMVSEASYDQTRRWLQYCYSHHEHCATSKTPFLPTRVIDVGTLDGVPKLVELNGHSSHYAALSYCWGGNQSVMADGRNIKEFFTQLPVSKLQPTLKDAISTTRELGLQFLWIDSLCIIQDSKDDKIRELSRMHEVYANAYVTIVAANAKDCNEGFLQPRIQLPDDPATVNFEAFSLPYCLQDGSFDEVTLQPYQSFRPSLEPVNVRAWTLQENLLSPRLLIYGSQLVRQCYSSLSPEFGVQRFSATPRSGATNFLQHSELGFAPRKPPFLAYRKLPPSDPDSVKHLQQLQWYWSEVVSDYSERQLTDVNDKLIAISGIARQLSATAFKDHSYKAGLWLPNSPNKTSFLYDLCWTTNSPSASQQASYLAPSWSWASIHVNPSSGVRLEKWNSHTPLLGTGQLCEIVQCEIIAEREDLFAHILGGSLTLQGILKEANVSSFEISGSNFEIVLPGQIKMPSELDRLLSFAAAFPSETVDLSNADTAMSTFEYNLSFSANFDIITPDLRENPSSVSVLCLRLLRNAGLLLTPISNSKFRRIGTFCYSGLVGSDSDESQVDGCFSRTPVTQVTII